MSGGIDIEPGLPFHVQPESVSVIVPALGAATGVGDGVGVVGPPGPPGPRLNA